MFRKRNRSPNPNDSRDNRDKRRDATPLTFQAIIHHINVLGRTVLNKQVSDPRVFAIEVQQQINALNEALTKGALEETPPPEAVIYLLLDLGTLKAYLDSPLSADNVQKILRVLPTLHFRSDFVSRIGIGITQLGHLAQENKISGKIDATLFTPLLEPLLSKSDFFTLSHIFYSLGLLADANHLSNIINTNLVTSLLSQLVTYKPPDAQKISNVFYGCGLLAKGHHLSHFIATDLLNALLDRITTFPPAAPAYISHIFSLVSG